MDNQRRDDNARRKEGPLKDTWPFFLTLIVSIGLVVLLLVAGQSSSEQMVNLGNNIPPLIDIFGLLIANVLAYHTFVKDKEKEDRQQRQKWIEDELKDIASLTIDEPVQAASTLVELMSNHPIKEEILTVDIWRVKAQKRIKALREDFTSGKIIDKSCQAIRNAKHRQAIQILQTAQALFDRNGILSEIIPSDTLNDERKRNIQVFIDLLDDKPAGDTEEVFRAIRQVWLTWDYFAKELVVRALPIVEEKSPGYSCDNLKNDKELRRWLRNDEVRSRLRGCNIAADASQIIPDWHQSIGKTVLQKTDLEKWSDQLELPSVIPAGLFSYATLPRKINDHINTYYSETTQRIFCTPIEEDSQLAAELAGQEVYKIPSNAGFPILIEISRTELRRMVNQKELLIENWIKPLCAEWLQILIRHPDMFLDLRHSDQRELAYAFSQTERSYKNWANNVDTAFRDMPKQKTTKNSSILKESDLLDLCKDIVKSYYPENISLDSSKIKRWFVIRPAGIEKTCLIFLPAKDVDTNDLLRFLQLLQLKENELKHLGILYLAFLPTLTAAAERFQWKPEELEDFQNTWVQRFQGIVSGPDKLGKYPSFDSLFSPDELYQMGSEPQTLIAQTADGSLWRLIELVEGAIRHQVEHASKEVPPVGLKIDDLRSVRVKGV